MQALQLLGQPERGCRIRITSYINTVPFYLQSLDEGDDLSKPLAQRAGVDLEARSPSQFGRLLLAMWRGRDSGKTPIRG
jgi:hypothetical protein